MKVGRAIVEDNNDNKRAAAKLTSTSSRYPL